MAYPFTAEEDEAFALQCGGPEMLKELEYYRQHQNDGVLRPISIGGSGTSHCVDLRRATVHEKFAIVYWGGARAETMRMWSFHITRNRPNARAFDETKDTAVNLASEHLRVLVDTTKGRIPLQDGMLLAFEGSVVYLEYTPKLGTARHLSAKGVHVFEEGSGCHSPLNATGLIFSGAGGSQSADAYGQFSLFGVTARALVFGCNGIPNAEIP